MNRKGKGINAERELIHLFWKTKQWAAIRVAGSGASRYPTPDILAGNGKRKLAIECKSIKGKSHYIPKDDVDQLLTFSSLFGAEPWIGVRFNKKGWYFLIIEDLKKSEKFYVVDQETSETKGLLFEELVGSF